MPDGYASDMSVTDIHLRTATEQSPLGTVIFDSDGRCLLVNAAWGELWDLGEDEVLDQGDNVFDNKEMRLMGLLPYLRETMNDGRIVTPILRYEPATSVPEIGPKTVPGTGPRWLKAFIYPVRDQDGGLLEVGLMLEDFTERRVLEQQLAHQAFHDSLTGLPNRALLTERLGHALARARQKEERSGASPNVETIALLFMDLDNFKRVNDSLGHQAGDQLLVGVAERVGSHLRPGDTFARLGGDEFAVLLGDVEDESSVMGLAERIVKETRTPFLVGGEEVFVTASIGVVLSDRGEVEGVLEGEELLRRADVAMYQSKRAGKDRCALFCHDTKNTDLRYLKLDAELRKAIVAGELRLHYQPTVLLETGEITGFEALVRWEHPQHGLLLPAQFIPLAEENGLIIPLGKWVLTEACRQARTFREFQGSAYADTADTPLKMSVNLSARQFRHPALAEEVARALSEADLEPRHLVLEITESVMMESYSTAQTVLENLKRLGLTLAVDDFGTGYSSLAFLKKFPVDTLKIDRSMVEGVAEDSEDSAIIRAITTLAHTLGLTALAEGVETAEELQMLRSLGCDVGQGYYWLKPSPADEAMGFLAGGLKL